jgi:hypothetical protein
MSTLGTNATNADPILSILHSATAEMLQRAQNRAYTDLLLALETTKRNHEMEVVKYQTLRYALTNYDIVYAD